MTMIRPTVALLLLAAAVVWWRWFDSGPLAAQSGERISAARSASSRAAPASLAHQASTPGTVPLATPVVDSARSLAELLTRQGLDGPGLAADYGAWRVALGFEDPATSRTYAAMDAVTLAELVAAGDLAAIQTQAGRVAELDGVAGLEQYGDAVRQGSAAAVFEVAGVLASLSGIRPEDTADNPDLTAMLGGLVDNDPERDLREEALAWSLAVIHRDGPGILEPLQLSRLEAIVTQLPAGRLDAVCSRVPALREQLEGFGTAPSPPPVFIAPPGVGRRLPCPNLGEITPPATCRSVPAQDARGAALDVWICPNPSR
jgi:hypothetical protein